MNENKLEDSKGFAALLRLVRPKQWIKNGFIFLPLFFGGALLHADALLAGLITFFAYSFAASSIYCFNDIYDLEADRRHPVKCHRPIASGAVSIKQAYGLMFLMFALSMQPARLMGDDGNHHLLLASESRLLRQIQAICHHRCVYRSFRFRTPSAGRWCSYGHRTQ